MASNYNFDDGTIKTEVHSGVQLSKETAMIQQNISLFVEVMDSLKTDEAVKKNELLKEIYCGQFKMMQGNITVLIEQYQDDEEILANLLTLHDWLEGVLAQYLRRVGSNAPESSNTPSPTNPEPNGSSPDKKQEASSSGSEGEESSGSDSGSDDSDSGSESEGEAPLKLKGHPNHEHGSHRHGHSGKTKGKGKIKVPPEGVTTTVAVSNGEIGLGPLSEPIPEKPMSTGYKTAEGPGECPICCEDSVPTSDLFIFETCSHQYCRECLQGYIGNSVTEGNVLDITCPAPGCKTLVEYHQVRAVVTPELFAKYEEFTFIASLNADPSVKWCPKPGCGNAIVGDPANPRCQCTNPNCRYEFCFLCAEPYHADTTCEQYQEWKAENGLVDSKFSNWAKKNTKKCPQCKTMIEKMAGCNHMTCSNCKYDFCWLCGGKYTSNHFDVFNVLGCPGMQSGSKQFGVARRIGMRALIGTGIVLGGIIGTALAIPAAVVAGPIYGGYKLHQRRKRASRRRRHYV